MNDVLPHQQSLPQLCGGHNLGNPRYLIHVALSTESNVHRWKHGGATLVVVVIDAAFSCVASRHLERGGHGQSCNKVIHNLCSAHRHMPHLGSGYSEDGQHTILSVTRLELHRVDLSRGSQKLADTATILDGPIGH